LTVIAILPYSEIFSHSEGVLWTNVDVLTGSKICHFLGIHAFTGSKLYRFSGITAFTGSNLWCFSGIGVYTGSKYFT